ncbi:MAG TPA: cation:proton antiporter, partial [Microbacteriaceae bacterium]|nr:cation:proton antiporter [Microbacteriaceae bacterium]
MLNSGIILPMGIVVTYLALIFGCGLIARALKLPALIGFLGAGFALNALNVAQLDALSVFADIGVTLMLFAIGLRLDLRSLLGKHVWITAGAHMVLLTGIGTLFLAGMSALGAFGPEPWHVLATLALVLSFSSTIFVVKILQERGDEQALYGIICIGVLIMQDIAAVVVISISSGQAPSLYSLGLLIVVPALYWATKHWYRLGHGDMGALFGIAMALIPGYALFEWLGLSGSLGALVMGLILAQHPGADQLSHTLFTVKELLLVGFFVTIGFYGLPTWHNVGVGMLLLLLLPLHALAYWALLWLLGMRNRTSVLSALLLSNYSEFALIIAAMGVSAGWLSSHWLLSLSIAVSAGFILSALLNP